MLFLQYLVLSSTYTFEVLQLEADEVTDAFRLVIGARAPPLSAERLEGRLWILGLRSNVGQSCKGD